MFNALACTANSCTPTQVSNSDVATAGSITGVTGEVSRFIVSECHCPDLFLAFDVLLAFQIVCCSIPLHVFVLNLCFFLFVCMLTPVTTASVCSMD
jgi:hypothetical protein